MACEVAASSSTGQLILFHHDPSYADEVLAGMERKAQSLFANTHTAYEGLEITVQLQKDDVQYARYD
jgi:ribonuclease BN (tRNA processing enzyme)